MKLERMFVALIAIVMTAATLAVIVYPLVKRTPLDYWQFYFAGKLVANGQVSQVHNVEAYKPLQQAARAQGYGVSIASYYNRPAFGALLCYPLGLLPYHIAFTLMTGCNLLLWALAVWKLPKWLGAPGNIRWWLLSYFPFAMSVGFGQDTILITLIVVYTCLRIVGRHPVAAGSLLALCLVKPHLIILLPLFFLLEREWRALRAFLIAGCALAVLSFALVGVTGVHQWMSLLGAASTDLFPSAMGNLRALAIHFGMPAAVLIGGATLAGGGMILARGSRAERLGTLVVLALLFSPHTYWQDYSLMMIFALSSPFPLVRYALLTPWPFFWPNLDAYPLALVTAACVVIRAATLASSPLAASGTEPHSPAPNTT